MRRLPATHQALTPKGLMFGLSAEKLLVILVIAVFIIGPQRLPEYAAKLRKLVRSVRSYADAAKERVSTELGPDFDDLEWKKLDPRQYDPRRIIRSALLDDPAVVPAVMPVRVIDENDPLLKPSEIALLKKQREISPSTPTPET